MTMKNFNLTKISLVVMTAVSTLVLTACNDDKKEEKKPETQVTKKTETLDDVFGDTKKPSSNASSPVTEQPKTETKDDVKTTSKPEDKVYKLSLKNTYSLSKQFAIDSFNQKDYQLAIEGLTEGVVLKPYRDNIGCAIGIGYNYYFQNKNTVQSVFNVAGVNQAVTDKIKAVSNKNESCIIDTSITAENARGIAKVDTDKNYKPGVIKLVGGADVWNKLSANEQQTLLYFPQKMGLGGAQKFKSLWANIKTYADNKTDANRQKVLSSMVVHYKIKDKDGNWVQKTDTRSHLLMSAMFTSPETFASVIGTSGADVGSFVKVAKAQNINIDSSKSIEDQVNENDDLNKTLSEITNPEVQVLDESGKVIDTQKSFETTADQLVLDTPKPAVTPKAMPGIVSSSITGGRGSSTESQTPKEKGNKSDLERAVGSNNVGELANKGYTGKKLSNGMIEVTPGNSNSTQQAEPKVSRKNQVCQKAVIIQGQQVVVPVPCEQ